MNKSELKEIIRETILTEMEGNSKYYPGRKTPGLTKKVMDTILMNIAKGTDTPREEDEVVGYVFWDKPEDPENYLQTRVYLNKKTGERYVKQVGDGVGEDLNQPPNNLKEGEEKTYEVTYFYRFGKYGDDKEIEDVKVQATSEAEAIEKVKETARRGAIQSSFRAELKK